MSKTDKEREAMTRLANYVNRQLNWQQKIEYCRRVDPEMMGDEFWGHWEKKLKIAKEVRRAVE